MKLTGVRSIVLSAITALLVAVAFPLVAGAEWSAGAARVCITPQQSMWMAGYAARTKPSEGKLNDLWVRALFVEDGQRHRGVIISLDLVGISRDLARQICEELQARFGFQRHQIALCCSHTHSGPVVGRNLEPLHYAHLNAGQQQMVDQYAAQLIQLVSQCVQRAIAASEPGTLAFGSGTCSFAVNRRNNSESEVTLPHNQHELKGPVDHDVPVLAVRGADNDLKAVLFGYACHATVLDGYQWSGDYPGFAQDELESSHPGAVAMFWAGCGADQNPLPRRRVELARQYGKQLAVSVEAVLEGRMSPIAGRLVTRFQEIDLPLAELPTEQQLQEETRSDNKYYAARARILLEQIRSGRPLAPTYPYGVGAWNVGDEVQFVFLGGEVVVDYALRLKAELSGTRTWVAGFANDVMAYIPSRRVLREGGYEGGGAMVYYGLPTVWSPLVENQICDTVHQLLEHDQRQ
jgi:hypothetical protein